MVTSSSETGPQPTLRWEGNSLDWIEGNRESLSDRTSGHEDHWRIIPDTDIQDDENQTGATQEDTPTDGLHKIGEPPSQGVGDTPREFKLANQGYSSEQPADQTEERRQALDLTTRRVDTFPRNIYRQKETSQQEGQAANLPASKTETSSGTTIPRESWQLPSQQRAKLLTTAKPTRRVGASSQPTTIAGEIVTSQPRVARARSVSILMERYPQERLWDFSNGVKKKERIIPIFLLAPMGVLASGSAHARPSDRLPIDTSENFPALLSAESPSNIEK